MKISCLPLLSKVLIVFGNGLIFSIRAMPKSTPGSEEAEHYNLTEMVQLESKNISEVDAEAVSKTISERTGKALGVPSDFTKQFNSSYIGNVTEEMTSPKYDDSSPAQLNAGPAVGPTEGHPGSDLQLTETEDSIAGNASGDANQSLSSAPAKQVEAVQPRLLYVAPEPTVSPEDKVIQRIFGGQCTLKVWNHCSRIKHWGGDYLDDRGKLKHHKIRCIDSSEQTLCLKNGWTVARCHMLCMSQCNLEFRLNYDKLVAHTGDCMLPILGRK